MSYCTEKTFGYQRPFAVQSHLVNGVQEVYRSQGIAINDKHIELIIRQMMRREIS